MKHKNENNFPLTFLLFLFKHSMQPDALRRDRQDVRAGNKTQEKHSTTIFMSSEFHGARWKAW